MFIHVYKNLGAADGGHLVFKMAVIFCNNFAVFFIIVLHILIFFGTVMTVHGLNCHYLHVAMQLNLNGPGKNSKWPPINPKCPLVCRIFSKASINIEKCRLIK